MLFRSVTDKGRLQLEDIHRMYKNGILELSFINSNNNVKVTFNEKEDKEIVLSIDDFRELGLQWLKYYGDNNIGKCGLCGKSIRKSKHNQKYCKECRKKVDVKISVESRKNIMFRSKSKK